jgi:RimJ/RimL family protein N-acetyltransferase
MWNTPTLQIHDGQHVQLRPLAATADVAQLYTAGHRTPLHLGIWRYLPYGPFRDQTAMHDWLVTCQASRDPLFHVVYDRARQRLVGIITIMSIVPEFGRAELGHIWYDTDVHRSRVNTESAFLLLSYLFDTLSYRRVEWKCDNRNEASKAAARRLGFSYEGTFRKHMIVKHHNRDTAWFSITDDEWLTQRQRFAQYLAGEIAHLGW